MPGASYRRPVAPLKTTAPVNGGKRQHRVLIGVPTLGTVRIEWHNAMGALVIPTNWQNSAQTPINFLTDDAQNIICAQAISANFDWVLFIEDDVLVPADLFQRLRPYMDHAKYPVVCGLYHLKTIPPEPMVYRGRGNGPYLKWKPGQVVEVDGVPTGCTLISVKLLKAVMAHRNETYTLQLGPERKAVPRIFETPRRSWSDPKTGSVRKMVGTSDLVFCDYVIEHGLLAKAGWKDLAKKPYPFICDTRIACGHIDRETGQVF